MAINKRILVISNYPIKRPLHGGQKRVAAIVEEYRKVFSDVRFVAIFVREHYPVYASTDLYLTGEWAQKAVHDHLTSDVKIGQAMTQSPELRRKIENLLREFKPDIIEIEQVFPYIGLQEILQDLGMNPQIIHSSHNVEAVMKKDIMSIAKASHEDITKAVAIIDKTESYLAQHSQLIATVSEEDGQYYKEHGAPNYILAPNGISMPTYNQTSIETWQKMFQKDRIRSIAVFVGSAHLPNMQGLEAMIGFRLGFLPPDTRLVLAGGVGQHLKDHFDHTVIQNTTFWRRAINGGILSEPMLGSLLHLADVLLLPIAKGGGSNLKTAEAILSGKKIVATSFAFRGYEQYLGLPNIWIADTPKEFKQAMVTALQTPARKRTESEVRLAEQVQWKHSLSNMVKAVKEL